MRNRGFVVAVILFGALAQGCGNQQSNIIPPTPPVLNSVSVSPATPSMAPVTTLQLRAVAMYSNGSQVDVTTRAGWGSASGAVATVNSSGLASSHAAGSTAITATFGGKSGSTDLTVSDLQSVAITPSAPTIARGTTEQFTATGTLQNSATQNLTSFATWSSSDAGIAAINGSGLATANTVATGTTTITATFSSVPGSTTLTAAAVNSIAVTPATASIANGTSQQFTSAGTLGGGVTTQNLTSWATWTSSNPLVATVSNAAGTKGLAASVSTGGTLITAAFDGVTSNSAALTITPATLSSLVVSPTSTSVPLGTKPQFTAIGHYSDNSTQDLTASATWASSASAVATFDNTSGPRGLATTVGTGTAKVSASFSGKTSNQATLTVTPAVLDSIDITPANPTVNLSLVFVQFIATGILSDGTTEDLTSTVTWNSSNSNVAVMNPLVPGKATMFIPGTTTITATSGSITRSSILTVQ